MCPTPAEIFSTRGGSRGKKKGEKEHGVFKLFKFALRKSCINTPLRVLYHFLAKSRREIEMKIESDILILLKYSFSSRL